MDIHELRDEMILRRGIDYIIQEGGIYLNMADVVSTINKYKKELLPVIPLFIAEHIERSKSRNLSLVDTMNEASSFDNIRIWLKGHINQDMFAKAWTVGYVTEREPKYEVIKDQYSFRGWLSTDSLHPEWVEGEGILFDKQDAINLAKLVGGEIRSEEDRRETAEHNTLF